MKPPQRRRAAPARYLGEASGPAAWSAREKRQLLRLLQARRGQPEPNAAELSRELPGRSEAEVWMDLAEKITGPLEEAVTAAFSQVFTIAATEPISLLHSKPSKPTQARGKQLLLSTPGEQEAQAPKAPDTSEVPGPAPKSPSTPLAGTSMEGDLTVDFEKIYKYLSSFSRSSPGPELSAAESAVVLDLLLSLPQELTRLPCTDLVEHMAGAYLRLMAPQPSSSSGNLESGAEAGGTGSKGHEQPSQATPQAPDNTRPHELTSAWQAAGVCPLNPFLVPLELLGRAATPAEDTPGRP
ncbi:snRNA-activating protein complex subunit 2 isoform X2 [Choloepus didactylus]|uniref:snRNA-activating protein complex subunit 2 isoform X2 n=1 Tax=Choloepus didactylus TaxID=27675 RepID=UPI00189ECD48|nr:snRNA-activating protein complex subunit 2 isoform X2 [Choloepus didactylus]